MSRRPVVAALAAACLLTAACSGGDGPTASESNEVDATGPDDTEPGGTDPADTATGDTIGDGTAPPDTDGGSADAPDDGLDEGWLLIVYQAADNNLEAAILDDIAELGAITAEELDVSIMFDRSDESDPSGGFTAADTAPGVPEEPGATQLLHAGAGGIEHVATIGEVNTGDPAQLAAFVTESLRAYPREHVAIVIGDHGAAWQGVAHDDTDGDLLTLPEIASGIEQGLAGAGRSTVDVVGFDACLMSSFEVAAAMAPYAGHMIASEEIEPGNGWDWTVLDALAPGTDARTLGTILVDGYASFYADESQISNQTMSLTDLSVVDELDAALSAFAASSGADPTASAVGLARGANRAYGFADSPDPAASFHQLDIGDLVETLAAQQPDLAPAATEVINVLDRAVVHHTHGSLSEQTTGLSIYLPPTPDLARADYFDLPGLEQWRALLASYLDTAASVTVPAAFSDEDKLVEGTWTTDGYRLQSAYDPAAEATIVQARLRYGTYDEDFTSMIFFGSDPLAFGDGSVYGVWDPQVLQVTDGTTTAPTYSTFDVSGDRSRAVIEAPLLYVSPEGDQQRVQLRFVLAQDGTLLSKDLVVYTDYGVGRIPVDPAGALYPLAAWQSLDTFDETWEPTSDTPLAADLGLLDATFVPVEETTAIVSQLELHAIDGSVDFVYAGDAVPYAYYEERATYPAP